MGLATWRCRRGLRHHRGDPAVVLGGSSIFSQIICIAIDGAILYYLNQPTIKALFGRA